MDDPNPPPADPLTAFVAALRHAHAHASDEAAMLREAQAAASALAARKSEWLTEDMCRPDVEQGFGLHLLHEEADHALATFVVSWLPRRGTTPHDHGTWAVVTGLRGAERNALWRRMDARDRPGYAEVTRIGDKVFGEDELLVMPAGVIHSVLNDTDEVTVSLHVYGHHVNHTQRSQFDPETRTETPYKVRVAA
jgi:predicted metal-dependent enzyme (double-stranded beta helix superfamily)